MEPKEDKKIPKLILSLVNFWPAALVVVLLMAALPSTIPVLKQIPELLVLEKTEAAEKTAAAERTASGENTEAASTPSAPEYSAPRVPPEKVSAAIPEGVSGIAPEAAFRPPELEEPYERTLRTGGYKEPSALSFISFFDLAILVIVLFLVALVIFSVT